MDFEIDVGWILGKRHQKINQILDAFLEAKKGVPQLFKGPPGGMRGAVGRNMEGYKDAKIAGETRTRHLELSGVV